MKVIFTVWSCTRDKKALIVVDDGEENLYDTLILKACTKLEVNGVRLVLESNGTPVDEDVLLFVKSEVLMLLQKEEIWIPTPTTVTSAAASTSYSTTNISSTSSLSTVTLIPSTDSNIQEQSLNIEEPQIVEQVKNCDIIYTVDCNLEYVWSSFEIPWEKLTTPQKEQLEHGYKDKATISNLVHLTVDEMRAIKECIPTKAFKIISKKIIDRYPDVFRDVDNDGIVLGDGTHSLVCKLQDRNNYLNRPHKRKSTLGDQNPIVSKKKSVSARARCPNWAPHISKNKVPSERAKQCKELDDDFYDILESSYPELRAFLNMPETPTILKIKEEWTIICSQKAIYWHFNKLTNSDIHLLNNLGNHLVKIQKLIPYSSETQENDTADCTQRALQGISTYFKENMDSFVFKCDNEDRSDLILTDMPLTPVIVEVGEGSPVFYVYVERVEINATGYDTFLDALKVAFALYFIFNIQYPKSFSVTLELVQRLIMKIHPDAGSKSKKITPTKKKVFNFINKFVKM